jgi:hypothetical protein
VPAPVADGSVADGSEPGEPEPGEPDESANVPSHPAGSESIDA